MQKVSELKYERVNSESVISVINDCTEKVKLAKNGKELCMWREKCLKPILHYATMASLSFMRFTLDTRNEFYAAEKDYYDETGPMIDAQFVKFKRAFLDNPHIDETRELINPIVLKQYALSIECLSDEAVPYRIEENKIVTEYTKLMAETLFEYEGEKMPLSSLRKYFTHADRSVRKAAYEVLGRTLESISDKLDDIFDRLVKVRTSTAKALGYENFTKLGDKLLGRISYGRDDIHAFRSNVLQGIVPLVAALKKDTAHDLKIDKFMLYDNDSYFTDGNPAPILNPEEMFEAGKKMYHEMNSETGEFFDFMLSTDAFDVFSREGKWGGGYCTEFIDYRQPFILANFNGTSADVDVLTHEAGHALASYESFKLNHDPDLSLGMETAETHSMSMELFCYKYIDRFFGKRSGDYKYSHLSDALTFIPYGTIVDYFQEKVYSHPDMTPAERNALWLKLESEFRPWLSVEGIPYLEKGTRWQYQMHIYENPFYYIDYCLAQSVAIQFFLKSLEDYDAAFDAYLDFVKKGASEEFPALVESAGLNSPFSEGALKKAAEGAKAALKKIRK